jgi:hypothetical protein
MASSAFPLIAWPLVRVREKAPFVRGLLRADLLFGHIENVDLHMRVRLDVEDRECTVAVVPS